MPKRFNWKPAGYGQTGPGMLADLPGDVSICVSPDQTVGLFGAKPKRGTTWRAQATHWGERTRTASRFGRDIYMTQFKTAKDAMRAAEALYLEAIGEAPEPRASA